MKNIFEIPYGWRVIIIRPGIKFDAFFKFGDDKAAALQRAIAGRDRFLDLHGRSTSGQAVRSNTGIAGVCETTKWHHGRPYECFQVTKGHPRNGIRKFYYYGIAERKRAFRRAVAFRARLAGEDAAGLLKQAEGLYV